MANYSFASPADDFATALESDPQFQQYVQQWNARKLSDLASSNQQPYGYWSSAPTGPGGEQERQFVPMPRQTMTLAAGPEFQGGGQYSPEETRTLSALAQPLPSNFSSLPSTLQMQLMEARKPVYKTTGMQDSGGTYVGSHLDRAATEARALQAKQALYDYQQKETEAVSKRRKSELDIAKSEQELVGGMQAPGAKAYTESLAKGRAAAELSKMPGTPEYIAAQKAIAEETARQRAMGTGMATKEARAATVLGAVDDAQKQIGMFSTGLPGQVLRNVGGTSAMDLDKTISTIKANLGFEELQKMREASKTGGALGQVAVKELEFLQSAVSALDTAQSPDQIRKNLEKVKKHYANWQKITSKIPQGQTQQPVAAGFDSAKEKRYQEWKRQQGLR